MTEDEHIAAAAAVTEFCVEIARAAARALQPFNQETRWHVKFMLQDAASLYAPFTADIIDAELKRMDGR